MQQKILILQGLPGSGKSTFAKELMTKEPGKYKRVNKDLFRIMFDNGVWNDKNEKFILGIRDIIVGKAIESGYHVILDDCNFAEKHIKSMQRICDDYNANGFKVFIEIKFLDTPVMECMRRDELRGEASVGKKNIMRMYDQYVRKEVVLVQDMGAPRAICVDIDGTLSNSKGRRGFYDWDKVYLDDVNEHVANVIRLMSRTYTIIVLSGRDGSCYNMTKKWLEDKKIPFDVLLMRKTGDTRPDEIVKREIFDEFIHNKYYVESVFDDRMKVTRMWRDLGLNVFQLGNPDIEF